MAVIVACERIKALFYVSEAALLYEDNSDSQVEIIKLAGNPVDLSFLDGSVIVSIHDPDSVESSNGAETVNIAIIIELSKHLLIM